MKLQYKIEYYVLLYANLFLIPVPIKIRHLLATFIGTVTFLFIPIRKHKVYKNLKIAFPESSKKWRRRIALKNYIHFAKVSLDFFPLWQAPSEIFNKSVKNPDRQVIEKALSQGNGAIIVSSHFGNWEAFGGWFAQNGYRFGAVAKRQKNPIADEFLHDVRSANGVLLFSMKENPVTILNFLKRNGILGVAADQDARKRGIFIKFFNQWASTFRGPAVFALRQNCPLIAGTCLLENAHYTIHLEEISKSIPKNIKEPPATYLTQLYNNYFEEKIKEHPEQYFWFHRRWKTKPPKNTLNQT